MAVGSEIEIAGISGHETQARLARDGPNELPQVRRRTALRIAFEVVREPMSQLLLATAVGVGLAVLLALEAARLFGRRASRHLNM